MSHGSIFAASILGLLVVIRLRYFIWKGFLFALFAPPEGYDRRIKPNERCWGCGARNGELKAVMESLPESNAKDQLLIEYRCKVCGAMQYFAPIVPSGDVVLAPCARVGAVHGKSKE